MAVDGQNMVADGDRPSWNIIWKRDDQKPRIGTVAMAGQKDLLSLRRHDPHLGECWFDILVEPQLQFLWRRIEDRARRRLGFNETRMGGDVGDPEAEP